MENKIFSLWACCFFICTHLKCAWVPFHIDAHTLYQHAHAPYVCTYE